MNDGHFDCDSLWAAEQRRLHASDELVSQVRSEHPLEVLPPEDYSAGEVVCARCSVIPAVPAEHARRFLQSALDADCAAHNTPQSDFPASHDGTPLRDPRESMTGWEASSRITGGAA